MEALNRTESISNSFTAPDRRTCCSRGAGRNGIFVATMQYFSQPVTCSLLLTTWHTFTDSQTSWTSINQPRCRYFLDALKVLRAIEYSNDVLRQLGPLKDFGFTHKHYQAQHTANHELQDEAHAAFDILARGYLPMYITHV